ncbi:hypothetical protein ACW2QC_09415 [Virgibacillus sp. FSP13]
MNIDHVLTAHGLMGRGGQSEVNPPSNLLLSDLTHGDNATISWGLSNDALIGYRYRLFVNGNVALEEDTLSTSVTINSSNFSVGDNVYFEVRVRRTTEHSGSSYATSQTKTVDKGTQSAPSSPSVSDIDFDRATVNGGTGTEVRLDNGAWYDSPHTFTGLTEETQYTAYARYKETSTHYASDISSGNSFTTASEIDDTTGSPGPKNLIAGDMQAGFFGEVPASELMNGTQLASAIGLSAGTAQHTNEPYLKFAYEGNIQFVAKKTFRYSLSWDQIDAADAVFGKTITIGGRQYKVRLMRGAENNPANSFNDADKDAIGSEWNNLMLPIHARASSGEWSYPQYVGDVDDWGIGFTDEDLLTSSDYGNGYTSWCQEVNDTTTTRRVARGGGIVSKGAEHIQSGTHDFYSIAYGWRPVLELL